MAGINTGKVIVGGLAGGVVMNVVDYVTNTIILKADNAAMVARLNLDPATMESTVAIVSWVVVDFLLAIILVFAYAAMRPRFGPGPRTAMVSGLTLWLAVTLVLYGFTSMGIFEKDAMMRGGLAALVSVLGGSLVGSALYKE